MELYSLCLLKFAARPELCTFSVPLWRLPNIWCIHVWIHFPVVTDSMLYEKYWFWGKNMFYVHIILKLCFILSWNGRPMQMDNKYLETWPWFKCAALNCNYTILHALNYWNCIAINPIPQGPQTAVFGVNDTQYTILSTEAVKSCSGERRLGESASLELFITR